MALLDLVLTFINFLLCADLLVSVELLIKISSLQDKVKSPPPGIKIVAICHLNICNSSACKNNSKTSKIKLIFMQLIVKL